MTSGLRFKAFRKQINQTNKYLINFQVCQPETLHEQITTPKRKSLKDRKKEKVEQTYHALRSCLKNRHKLEANEVKLG